MELNELHQIAIELESMLRVKTYPLAIKMLKNEGEIPEGAVRPWRDLGYHLSTCQLFAMVRREAICAVQLKEDMWCVEPVIGYGMVEPPEFFLEGNNRYPGTASTQEAGRTWARAFPRFNAGDYIGVACAPLRSASFMPDMAMIYCDPSQLTQILMAKNWIDGKDIASQLSGHAACVYAIVPVVTWGQWAVSSPCRGDRARGLAGDDEEIASLPTDGLPDLLNGLKALQADGRGLPLMLSMQPEYQLPPPYVEIARMIGMDWAK